MSSRKRSIGETVLVDDITLPADALLQDIRDLGDEIQRQEAEYQQALAALTEKHRERVSAYKAELVKRENLLMLLMKQNRQILFDGRDIVRLANGALIHGTEDRVKIPRDALSKCEQLGFNDAVKIAKSIDREAIEKWPDEKLFLIGAERKPRETFSYDLSRSK